MHVLRATSGDPRLTPGQPREHLRRSLQALPLAPLSVESTQIAQAFKYGRTSPAAFAVNSAGQVDDIRAGAAHKADKVVQSVKDGAAAVRQSAEIAVTFVKESPAAQAALRTASALATPVVARISDARKSERVARATETIKGTRAYKAAQSAAAAVRTGVGAPADGRRVSSATASLATRAGGAAARVGGAVGRALPGISIGIAALDSTIAVKTCASENASGTKKGLAVATAALSSVAAAAANSVPFVGNAVGLVAGVGAAVTGWFRDKA